MPTIFHFQHTLNRFFNICGNLAKVILILDYFFLKYEEERGEGGGHIEPHPEKHYPQKPSSIRVKK